MDTDSVALEDEGMKDSAKSKLWCRLRRTRRAGKTVCEIYRDGETVPIVIVHPVGTASADMVHELICGLVESNNLDREPLDMVPK